MQQIFLRNIEKQNRGNSIDMIIRACAFTSEGWKLVDTLESKLNNWLWERKDTKEETDVWVKKCFEFKMPLVFVGAMGIAVRKIAPYLADKLADSPVIVIDEKGQYVIPVLSNHVGGANEIAAKIAENIGGQLILTTATDVQGLFAVDVFARKNGLQIMNREGIKRVSARLLETGTIKLFVADNIEYDSSKLPDCIRIVNEIKRDTDVLVLEDASLERYALKKHNDETSDSLSDIEMSSLPGAENPLVLLFKEYVMGVGCKKDTVYEKLEDFYSEILDRNGIDKARIAGMASIDLKQKETGLLYYESKNRIPFYTYSAEELQALDGVFEESLFVQSVTGVANVCERAAVKLAGDGGELLIKKQAKDGMTLAVARRRPGIMTWET